MSTAGTFADGAYSLLCNINDTLRSRGFGPECGQTDERVIAMANELDRLRAAMGAGREDDGARGVVARLVKWNDDFPKGMIHPYRAEKVLDEIVADAKALGIPLRDAPNEGNGASHAHAEPPK